MPNTSGPTLTLSAPVQVSLGNPALNRFGVVMVNGTVTNGDGSSPAGEVITLSDNGITLPLPLPVVANAQGQFSTTVALTGLQNSLVASARDNSGNTGSSAPTNVSSHTDASLFGTTTSDPNSVGGQVYALYEAALGRAPDPVGFENTVAAVQSGASLNAVAQSLLSSPEYTAHYGAAAQRSPSDFVTTLYQNALGRNPDPVGYLTYTTELATGTSEAQVALNIGLSPEAIGHIRPTFEAPGGVFVPDASDSAVARLYYGLLNRAPDSGGLGSFENLVRQGTPLADIVNDILSSPEYLSASANQSNTQFVQSLYADALGRAPDAGGGQAWVATLNAGTARAAVALGVIESQEAQSHLAGNIEVGHRLI